MKLDQDKIKLFYNNIPNVWWENDPWHEYSKKIITAYIKNKDFFRNSIVLNAGSAGNSYDINCGTMYHVDIADEKIKGINNAVVASIENLPFNANSFDNILCVGSVLNYCDAVAAISELSRVLKPNGNLILEFESSWGFEYFRKECYKRDACIITTEYIEKQHKQWLYSPKYIYNILNSYNFHVIEKYPFHIFDGLFTNKLGDRFVVAITNMDKFFRVLPYVNEHGNNIIIHCRKTI